MRRFFPRNQCRGEERLHSSAYTHTIRCVLLSANTTTQDMDTSIRVSSLIHSLCVENQILLHQTSYIIRTPKAVQTHVRLNVHTQWCQLTLQSRTHSAVSYKQTKSTWPNEILDTDFSVRVHVDEEVPSKIWEVRTEGYMNLHPKHTLPEKIWSMSVWTLRYTLQACEAMGAKGLNGIRSKGLKFLHPCMAGWWYSDKWIICHNFHDNIFVNIS